MHSNFKKENTYRNSLLITDLAPHVCPGVKTDGEKEVGKATQTATVTNYFSILPHNVAWAEVGDDA